ncbi:MAG: Smr/MutS family protein [Bdellovibrionia bacterium]
MTELKHIDWPEILAHLETLASSEVAREFLRQLGPLKTQSEALESFAEIEVAQLILNLGRRPQMQSLDLFQTWFERLRRQAVLKPLELKDVRRFCHEAVDLKDASESFSSPWLKSMTEEILDAKEPLSAIDQLLTPGGEIRTDASETLASLFKEKQEMERELQNTLNRLVKQHGLEPVLQDRFVTNREGRWVVPVKSGKQHSFEGVIHDSSQSKQTVFMEPKEVVELNNQIRQIDIRIEREIEILLTELSQYLSSLVRAFEDSKEILHRADIRLAQGQFATQIQAQPCTFSDDRIYLTNVRHPLMVLRSDKTVPNHVEFTAEKRILLLSGPNAGGKTVLLKAVGLAVHMARCGLLPCADDSSQVPFFKELHVAVGDEQSVDQNLSTFAAHLKTLTDATKVRGHAHLLLFDEICGATDPDEGAALARSFIEHYEKNEVFAIITSHLGPLKENWPKESGVINGRLEYDEMHGRPTYRLYLGLPGQSLALKTAKNIGVPQEIIDRAMALLHPHTRQRQQKLDELETIKVDMMQIKQRFEIETKQAMEDREKYQELVEKFKREREKWMQKSIEKGQKQIDNMIEEAKLNMQNTKALNDIKGQLPQIIKAPQKAIIRSPEEFGHAYPSGSKVYVTQIQQDGIVQGAPDGKGMVAVLSQSMRIKVNWKDLQPPRAPIQKSTTQSNPYLAQTSLGREERVIDLRGQRVEEALGNLESHLDVAMKSKEDRVKIIHGHGTDALKKAVRSYLSRSVYVRKWKTGDQLSGGDGVTWVELMD